MLQGDLSALPGRGRSRALVSFLDLLGPTQLAGTLQTLDQKPEGHLPGILAAYRLDAGNAPAKNFNSQIQGSHHQCSRISVHQKPDNIILLSTGSYKPAGQSLCGRGRLMSLSTHEAVESY
jgi:hypothetical protein